MMSSEGFFARQSTYSANASPAANFGVSFIGLPPLVRICASGRSRIACWSSSGMPSSIPIVFIGTSAPRSAMKSKPSEPTCGSRHSALNARTLSSSAAIFFGVNTLDMRLRWMVCTGGSS